MRITNLSIDAAVGSASVICTGQSMNTCGKGPTWYWKMNTPRWALPKTRYEVPVYGASSHKVSPFVSSTYNFLRGERANVQLPS